jgi:hypothetical protein
MQKEWTSPELVVLVRNKPEESVLQVCKHLNIFQDPNDINENCQLSGDLQLQCDLCYDSART